MSSKSGKQDVGHLITEHTPLLKAFIRKRVTNKEDADDILQDVFYQLVKTIESALNPIEQVTAWLYRVTRNTIINKEKKKGEGGLPVYRNEEGEHILDDFSEVLFGHDTNTSPETEYMRSLVWEQLEQALAELAPEQREAFEWIELNGLPVKELSATTGIQVNTLLSRKHYAVLHLRKRLAGLYKEILEY